MARSVLTILLVATLAHWIQGVERAAGRADGTVDAPPQWVRTVNGWESRQAVAVQPRPTRGQVHPGLVAAFMVGASVFSLVAFPPRVAPQPAPKSAGSRRITARRKTPAAAAR